MSKGDTEIIEKEGYFVLFRKTKDAEKFYLKYHKEKDDAKPISTIPIQRVVKVTLLPQKRTGCRFDIKMDNSRIYALDATSKKDAKDWVETLNQALAARDKKIAGGTSTAADTSVKWTKFQEFFFKLKYGDLKDDGMKGRKGGEEAEKKKRDAAVKEFNDKFQSNSHILKYILEHVLDPNEKIDDAPAAGRPELKAQPSKANLTAGGETGEKSERKMNHVHQTKLRKEGNLELAEAVKKQDFLRNLMMLFGKKDTTAHNLALRVLFIILQNTLPAQKAADGFAENVQIFCSEHKFNKEIKQGLFAILFQDGEQIVKECEKVLMIGFNKPFMNPQALRALFFALKGSEFDLRRSALEDLNTTLIGSTANCNALQESKNWQDWVWNLLTDIPKEKQDEKAKKLYGYAMNVFAVVHFQSYTQSESFYPQVCDTLDSLYLFGGPSHQTYEVGRVVLLSIVNKLKASKKLFQTDDHTGVQWTNFRTLIELINKFTFQTAHWRSEGSGPPLLHKRDNSNMSTIDQQKAEEMKRMAAEKQVGFILAKARVGSNAQPVPFNESQEFGVHFSESGKAGDVKLLQTFLQLFEELHLDKFDQETSGNLGAEDIVYLKRVAADYQYFQDSVELLDLCNRTAIEDHLITWRKVANVAQRHVAAMDQPKTRKSIREEVKDIVTGKKPMGAPVKRDGESGKKDDGEEGESGEGEPSRSPSHKANGSGIEGEQKKHKIGARASGGSGSVASPASPRSGGTVSKQGSSANLGGNTLGKKGSVSKMDDDLKEDIRAVGSEDDPKAKVDKAREARKDRTTSQMNNRKKSNGF